MLIYVMQENYLNKSIISLRKLTQHRHATTSCDTLHNSTDNHVGVIDVMNLGIYAMGIIYIVG
jgi:hypothetical protein